jgi:hopene-associated glycosyltransferase HpnB
MPSSLLIVLSFLGAIPILIWLGILFHPARPWDFQPVGEDGELPPGPAAWPSVCVLVPARNEAESLPQTLPALLKQDYPGELSVIVIDDRSDDGTTDIARKVAKESGAANRLTVITGAALPDGWVGKVWALEQGAYYGGLQISHERLSPLPTPQPATPNPQYFLLTDADIRHAPGSLRRLVAESEQDHLALNSRMARLRCVSDPERLLIPPFVFFFNLLYPMRRVNNPQSSLAAAAGGCVLLASSALKRAGGFACIKDKIIDDLNLARQIKHPDAPIRLALSRNEVESLRSYNSLGVIWTMVRRTAFTELRYSWLRLLGTVLGLAVMFLLPPLWLLGATGLALASILGPLAGFLPWAALLAAEGFFAWALMAVIYRPAVRFFALPGVRSWTLPLAGVLYGAMTVDSALRHALRHTVRHVIGMHTDWRD